MALVPENNIVYDDINKNVFPNKTYKIDFEDNCVNGMCDGIQAVEQAIYKILNTERYVYVIYDRNYGTEIRDLIGRPMTYVSAVLKGRIEEALICDDRILGVEGFGITKNRESISAEFTVKTVYGDVGVVKNFVV